MICKVGDLRRRLRRNLKLENDTVEKRHIVPTGGSVVRRVARQMGGGVMRQDGYDGVALRQVAAFTRKKFPQEREPVIGGFSF